MDGWQGPILCPNSLPICCCDFSDIDNSIICLCHLPSEKSILPFFSGPRGVAISVPFPEVRNRKGAESGLQYTQYYKYHHQRRYHHHHHLTIIINITTIIVIIITINKLCTIQPACPECSAHPTSKGAHGGATNATNQ